MKKVLLIMTLLMSFGFSLQQCHEESGWCFDQQVFQAFYLFHESAVTFDYALESSALDEGDVIAAFKDDQCVGFYIIDLQEITLGGGVITVPLMGSGNEGDDGYLVPGDIPDFVMFDISNMIPVCVNVSGDELTGFASNELFSYHGLFGEKLALVTGNDQDCDGCAFSTDNDDTVPVDDPCDCQGPSDYCDCTGQPIDGYCSCSGDEIDCLGECGGDAIEDCLGECGGDAVVDCLGECGGIAQLDCDGVCDGSAFENDCGCVGGSTGLEVDCCLVCNDEYAFNYDDDGDGIAVGICNGEQVYDDINGNGQYDGGEEFEDLSICVPNPADGLTATVYNLDEDGGAIELSWNEVLGNLSHYEISRILIGEDGEESQEIIISTNSLSTTYIDQNLNPDTQYSYKVRAVHVGGNVGGWSNSDSDQTYPLIAPQVVNLVEGEEILEIVLSIPSLDYNNIEYTYELERTSNGEQPDIISSYDLTISDRTVTPNIEYCYVARSVWRASSTVPKQYSSWSNQLCGTPLEPSGWTVTVEASIEGLGVFYEDDLQNYLGMSPLATNGFDADGIDFPEPPPNPGNFIQFYFPHDDWQAPYTDYTQDIREYRELADNLETWSAEVVSNMDGPVELKFKFDDYGSYFGDSKAPIKFPIYVLMDGVYELVEMPRCLGLQNSYIDFNGNNSIDTGELCHEILDNDSCYGDCSWYEDICLDIEFDDDGTGTNYIQSINPQYEDEEGNIINDKSSCESQDYTWFGNNIIEYESVANEVENIDIIVGNLPPQIPTGLVASAYNPEDDPAAAWVTLEWDETEECCQTLESRYPATHYYIYRLLYGEEDTLGTIIDETTVLYREFIDNCSEARVDSLNMVTEPSPTMRGTSILDENNSEIEIDRDYCKKNRYDFMGIVYADQFSYIDSSLNIRAIPFLDKIIDDYQENAYEENGNANQQWLVDNSRYIFETDFRYVVTAVNEKYAGESSALPTDIYSFTGVESLPSDTVVVTTRVNEVPTTSAGNDQYETVPHDNYHMSMEPFQDTGIDGQPNTNDFRDYGLDGLLSQNEPGWHPTLNPDPNNDDWHPVDNPSGTEGNDILDYIDLNNNEIRDPEDIGEPGENDGKFTFLDYGSDRTPSKDEDGYDPVENPDPNGDDWHPNNNPNGTEGNFIHDIQEYSEQFSDIGCDGCGDIFEDSNGNGCWDTDEECTDIDGNESCDVAACNGVWEGNNDYVRIFLNGYASSDPEYGKGEDALDFDWQQISGPNVFLNTKESKNFINCGEHPNNSNELICEKLCNGSDDQCQDINNWIDNPEWIPQYGNDYDGNYSNATCDEDYDTIIKYFPEWEEASGESCYYGGDVQPYFDAVVPNGEIQKVYQFELRAKDTYLKGWPAESANHSYPENVTITVNQEGNVAPTANISPFSYNCSDAPVIVLCDGDWECDYSVSQYDNTESICFDWSAENNIQGPSWRIPHDGDPGTNMATVGLVGADIDLNGDGVISGAEIGSSDNLVPYENNEEMQAQEDEIFFNWTTGRSPEPYNDLNQNGMFDLFETFFDLNSNGIWDSGDPYSGSNLAIDREADSITVLLTVTDTYGAQDLTSIEIKVLHEQNSKPMVDAGSDQTWYLDEFSETHPVTLPLSDGMYVNGEWVLIDNGNFVTQNLSYDPDILGLYDCGVDGLCDEDEEGFSFYGPDGLYDSGDEIYDPEGDGCYNPIYRNFYYSDCASPQTALEGNNIFDGGLEFIDYDNNGEYTSDLGDGVGEEYRRDNLTYKWYSSENSSDFIEGPIADLDLEPGTHTYYLEVCDAYDGYPKNEYNPYFGTWNETTYDGCALDSVTITILDEEPPSKPSAPTLTRSLYSIDIDWEINNMDENCLDRSSFEEDCKPGFVDKYNLYRNGQLVETFSAWVDGLQDGVYLLNPDYDDLYIDCGIYNDQKICELECLTDDCENYDSWTPNEEWIAIYGNNQYDPDEPFSDCFYDEQNIDDDEDTRFICDDSPYWQDYMGDGRYNKGEDFIDCYYVLDNDGNVQSDPICSGDSNFDIDKANGRWDDAEDFIDCNIDLTICVGDEDDEDIDPDELNGIYDEGEPFVDSNSNGKWDGAEQFIDCGYNSSDDLICQNDDGWDEQLGNGVYDPPEPFTDWNDNGVWDTGDIFYSSTNGESNDWDKNGDGSYTGDYIRTYPNFVDEDLDPDTEYCYFVTAINSSGISSYPSPTSCIYTAILPTVNILSPNGAEIYTKGKQFGVEWEITDGWFRDISPSGEVQEPEPDPEASYIDKIFIEYRIGEFGYPSNGENIVWYTEDYSNLTESNKAYISIFDLEDIEMNKVEIRLTIEDINGISNHVSYTDISDNRFTLSTNLLSRSFPDEWSLIGCPLDLSDEINWSDVNADGEINDDDIIYANDMIYNLGTDQNLGNFGTDWYIYNENGEFPTNFGDVFPFQHGKGYILSLFQSSGVTLKGGVVDYPDPNAFQQNATLNIKDGWNLISNMLVSSIDKDKLWIKSFNQFYTWEEAVNFGFVQSEIHGWNNNISTYQSVDQVVPWEGYWLHASRDLELKFRPHVEEDIVQRESRSDTWSLNLVARGLSNGSAGDFISVGLSDSANIGFKYGEDEYDIPAPLGDKYIDLFFDRSDWAGSPPDENGNSVSEVEFYRDIRPYSGLGEPNYWHISTNTYADEGIDSIEAWNANDEVQLSWNQFDAILGLPDHNIFLHIDDQYFDMKIEESVILSDINNREIVIQIGGSSPLAYDSVDIPTHFSVSAAYPNPFNPIANLDYAIPNSDNVKISIFNINGQLVETLLDEFKTAGYHTVRWNAYNISSGIYFVKVESGQNVSTQKLMLMK